VNDFRDAMVRAAAAEHVRRVAISDTLTSEQLSAGFEFEGERVPLVNPQRGIFKPRSLKYLLWVRTVFPRSGARVWYDDQRVVHEQVSRVDELIDYAFMGSDPEAADNRWLREAHNEQVPFLYFLGVAPGRYTAIWPTYIAEWMRGELKVKLAFGQRAVEVIPEAPERRYASRIVQQRLHQAVPRGDTDGVWWALRTDRPP
jgi:putative restriction endonuclease